MCYKVPWTHVGLSTKQHLSQFSRFCTAHPCAKHTDTQTLRPRYVRHVYCVATAAYALRSGNAAKNTDLRQMSWSCAVTVERQATPQQRVGPIQCLQVDAGRMYIVNAKLHYTDRTRPDKVRGLVRDATKSGRVRLVEFGLCLPH